MSGFVAFVFTSAQLVDIRRFCGYPAYGDGGVVFPFPWIMRQYLALEYRLQHMSSDEGNVVVTKLAELNTLDQAVPTSGQNLDTAQAAVWTHNANEVGDRESLFALRRRALCDFIGVPPGPNFASGGGIRVVV